MKTYHQALLTRTKMRKIDSYVNGNCPFGNKMKKNIDQSLKLVIWQNHLVEHRCELSQS